MQTINNFFKILISTTLFSVSKEEIERRAASTRVRVTTKWDSTSSSPLTEEDNDEPETNSSDEEILPPKKKKVLVLFFEVGF